MNGLAWTRAWEGDRLSAYQDGGGVWTIGVGHTGPNIQLGLIWSQAQVDAQYQADYEIAQDNALRAAGHGLSPLGDARWAVLADMAFQMGLHGLEAFQHMLDALRHGAWSLASQALLDSKYANDDSPRRAKSNAQILLTGEWITPHPNDSTLT